MALIGRGEEREKKGSRIADRLNGNIDPYVANLLDNIDEGKTVLELGKDKTIFSQGRAADAIYFIQDGNAQRCVWPEKGSCSGHAGCVAFWGKALWSARASASAQRSP